MVKHNNVLPNGHFRKEWDLRIRTWLDQPARKQRRRDARKAKAAAAGSRPLDKLRPVVRGQSARYNTKVRAGRGFTLEEIKGAGVTVAVARSVGVSVDHRRTNKSNESLAVNVQRLKQYLSKVVVAQPTFKKSSKSLKLGGGITSASRKTVQGMAKKSVSGVTQNPVTVTSVKASDLAELQKGSAFAALRQEWVNARLKGKREKRAKEAAAEGETAAKKGEE